MLFKTTPLKGTPIFPNTYASCYEAFKNGAIHPEPGNIFIYLNDKKHLLLQWKMHNVITDNAISYLLWSYFNVTFD